MCSTCGNRVDGLSKSGGSEHILCTDGTTTSPGRGYIAALSTILAQLFTPAFSTLHGLAQHLGSARYPRCAQGLLLTTTTYINK